VTGLTFAVVGVLLLLDAWDAIALPAGAIPAVLLVGLGASLIVGRSSEEG
jgi:multidrug efflux pump subunit AcrB